mgnify:CR=1 FL=1
MIVLTKWKIFKVRSKQRIRDNNVLVVAYREAADDGYISDPVVRFDQPSMTIHTKTGEVLKLDGESGGYSRDADRAWMKHCSKYHVTGMVDVSSRYVARKKRERKAA